MPFHPTPLPQVRLYEPRLFHDQRGYFFESFNARVFQQVGLNRPFVQDNQARSTYGVLRGMHFQTGEHAQAKLVRVIEGEVYDVVVDLRPESETYKKWFGTYLTGDNNLQLYVPRGFAHGYLVTSEIAVFAYKCDNYYAPEAEAGIRYDDPEIGIEWPEVKGGYIVAERDLGW